MVLNVFIKKIQFILPPYRGIVQNVWVFGSCDVCAPMSKLGTTEGDNTMAVITKGTKCTYITHMWAGFT